MRAVAANMSPSFVPRGSHEIATGLPPKPAPPTTKSGIRRSPSPIASNVFAVPRSESAELIWFSYCSSSSIRFALIRPV